MTDRASETEDLFWNQGSEPLGVRGVGSSNLPVPTNMISVACRTRIPYFQDQNRKEPMPQDFVRIEEVLQRIGREATQGKPCYVAPEVKLPPLHSPQPAGSSLPS